MEKRVVLQVIDKDSGGLGLLVLCFSGFQVGYFLLLMFGRVLVRFREQCLLRICVMVPWFLPCLGGELLMELGFPRNFIVGHGCLPQALRRRVVWDITLIIWCP